jgi:hypothetical protein
MPNLLSLVDCGPALLNRRRGTGARHMSVCHWLCQCRAGVDVKYRVDLVPGLRLRRGPLTARGCHGWLVPQCGWERERASASVRTALEAPAPARRIPTNTPRRRSSSDGAPFQPVYLTVRFFEGLPARVPLARPVLAIRDPSQNQQNTKPRSARPARSLCAPAAKVQISPCKSAVQAPARRLCQSKSPLDLPSERQPGHLAGATRHPHYSAPLPREIFLICGITRPLTSAIQRELFPKNQKYQALWLVPPCARSHPAALSLSHLLAASRLPQRTRLPKFSRINPIISPFWIPFAAVTHSCQTTSIFAQPFRTFLAGLPTQTTDLCFPRTNLRPSTLHSRPSAP